MSYLDQEKNKDLKSRVIPFIIISFLHNLFNLDSGNYLSLPAKEKGPAHYNR